MNVPAVIVWNLKHQFSINLLNLIWCTCFKSLAHLWQVVGKIHRQLHAKACLTNKCHEKAIEQIFTLKIKRTRQNSFQKSLSYLDWTRSYCKRTQLRNIEMVILSSGYFISVVTLTRVRVIRFIYLKKQETCKAENSFRFAIE